MIKHWKIILFCINNTECNLNFLDYLKISYINNNIINKYILKILL